MLLKVQFIFDATQVIGRIIDAGRPLPLKGSYRLARMHAKLAPEWKTINDKRTAMIVAYDNKNEDGQPAVPDDKMEEFVAAWAEFAKDEVEVDVQPIPLASLDFGDAAIGSFSALELLALDNLVEG